MVCVVGHDSKGEIDGKRLKIQKAEFRERKTNDCENQAACDMSYCQNR